MTMQCTTMVSSIMSAEATTSPIHITTTVGRRWEPNHPLDLFAWRYPECLTRTVPLLSHTSPNAKCFTALLVL